MSTVLPVKLPTVPRARKIDLRKLVDSWEIHLRAERKSPATLRSYLGGVKRYLEWCENNEMPLELGRRSVQMFIIGRLEAGKEAGTARTELRNIRLFSAWLLDEGEIERDDLAALKSAKVDEKVVQRLTEDECRRLIEACAGKAFRDRRDEAIVRLLIESPCRSGDIVGMNVDDVQLARGLAVIRRGKGGKGRLVSIGPTTGRAIDRYMRLRRDHRLADTPKLWLGDRGRTLAYGGLAATLRYRARRAGLPDFYPHLTRHTAAQRWLEAGGSEGGLMAIAGWSSRQMLDRYTRSTAADRAVNEARTLRLGEL